MPFTLPYRFFSDRLPRERTRAQSQQALLPDRPPHLCKIIASKYTALPSNTLSSRHHGNPLIFSGFFVVYTFHNASNTSATAKRT